METKSCHSALLGQMTYTRGMEGRPNSDRGDWEGWSQLGSLNHHNGDFPSTASEAGQGVLKTLVKGSNVYIYSSREGLGGGTKIQGGDTWSTDTVKSMWDATYQYLLSVPDFTRVTCSLCNLLLLCDYPSRVAAGGSFWIIYESFLSACPNSLACYQS